MSAHITNLVIRSEDRIQGSSSDFTVKIPTLTRLEYVELQNISIPNTLYNITSNNNVVYFNDGVDKTATLTPGNYTTDTLLVELKTQMDLASAQVFTITYSETSYKLMILSTGNFMLTMGTNSLNSAGKILGFRTDTVSAMTQIGDSCLNLQGDLHLYLDIEELGSHVKSTSDKHSSFVLNKTVLGSYIESFSTNQRYSVSTCYNRQNITKFSIKIKNNNGVVDLNGSDWEMLLKLHYY